MVEAGKDLTEWLPRNNTLESYTGISLMNNNISKIPDYKVDVPRLNTFLIQNNKLSMISNEFIGGMKQARVLDMNSNEISSLPQSLKLLTKLRMLDLGGNISLHEISIFGELKELEILILTNSGIKKIPQEIGELVNLRRLEVDGCKSLSHISPGVLLKLCWLEELIIGFYSMTKNKIHDSLVEVTNLSKLTHLNLWVPFDIIPEGFVSEKFKGITIHDNSDRCLHSLKIIWFSKYYLVLNQTYLKIPFLKWIRKFIEVSPDIYLIDIFNLCNILPTLYHEGFNKLESIWLRNCRNVSCLVDTTDKDSDEVEWPGFHLSKDYLGDEWKTKEKFFTKLKHLRLEGLMSLKVLWNCPDQYMSLSNLVTIHIYCCWTLVRLFPVSGPVSLQTLSIIESGLEEVIWGGDDEQTDDTEIVAHSTNIIVFPCLAKIYFRGLNRLRSFCSGHLTIKYPSLEEVNIRDCGDMKKWGDGILDTPKLKFVDDVRLDGRYGINDAVVKSSQRWKRIRERRLEVMATTMEAARRIMMAKFDS